MLLLSIRNKLFPDTIGTYEIRAMAVDNGGVSLLSKPHQILVKNPIGEKPIAVFEFPTEFEDRDPFFFKFLFQGVVVLPSTF